MVRSYAGNNSNVYLAYDEAGHLLGEYDNAGNPVQQFLWLGDLPVGVLAGSGASQKLHYIEPDHLGTPRVVIDGVRNVAIWKWDSIGEAFGNTPPNQNPDGDGTNFVFNLRYPGQRYDSTSGFNYNYFRDYDPSAGRYVQSDPVGLLASISTYAYTDGSPLVWTDSLGLAKDKVRARWSACNYKDMELCQKQCGSRGVESCRRRWIIATEIIGGVPVEGWVPRELSCNCNENFCQKNPNVCTAGKVGAITLAILGAMAYTVAGVCGLNPAAN